MKKIKIKNKDEKNKDEKIKIENKDEKMKMKK